MERCKKFTEKEKKVIGHAIAHLNGYVLILEKEKRIPALAVKEDIAKLKKILRCKWK